MTRLEFAKIYGVAPDQLRMTLSMSVLSALIQGTDQRRVCAGDIQTAANVSLNAADIYIKTLSGLPAYRDPL